jgi:hypothetical protein
MPLALSLQTSPSPRKTEIRSLFTSSSEMRRVFPFLDKCDTSSVWESLSRLLDGKSFLQATREDLVNVVSGIESEETHYDTKCTEKECIKCFYRWLKGGDEGDKYPSEVKWIKSKRARNYSILPENLVTEDEVKLMAESYPNKLLVSVLGVYSEDSSP